MSTQEMDYETFRTNIAQNKEYKKKSSQKGSFLGHQISTTDIEAIEDLVKSSLRARNLSTRESHLDYFKRVAHSLFVEKKGDRNTAEKFAKKLAELGVTAIPQDYQGNDVIKFYENPDKKLDPKYVDFFYDPKSASPPPPAPAGAGAAAPDADSSTSSNPKTPPSKPAPKHVDPTKGAKEMDVESESDNDGSVASGIDADDLREELGRKTRELQEAYDQIQRLVDRDAKNDAKQLEAAEYFNLLNAELSAKERDIEILQRRLYRVGGAYEEVVNSLPEEQRPSNNPFEPSGEDNDDDDGLDIAADSGNTAVKVEQEEKSGVGAAPQAAAQQAASPPNLVNPTAGGTMAGQPTGLLESRIPTNIVDRKEAILRDEQATRRQAEIGRNDRVNWHKPVVHWDRTIQKATTINYKKLEPWNVVRSSWAVDAAYKISPWN